MIEPKWRDRVQIELLGSNNSDRGAIAILPSEIRKLDTKESTSEDTCSRIEETRKRLSESQSSPSSTAAVATARSPGRDEEFLPGTPRGIFLSPRSRARLRRSGGFREGE